MMNTLETRPTTMDKWQMDSLRHELVDVDFLLPNGLFCTLTFSRETTIEQVKQALWDELFSSYAYATSLLGELKSASSYVLASVSVTAAAAAADKLVEYYDTSKRLCDLELVVAFFQLLEERGDVPERAYHAALGKTLAADDTGHTSSPSPGGLHLNEIEQIRDAELLHFRLSLFRSLQCTYQTNDGDGDGDNDNKSIEYFYAPNLEIEAALLDVSLSSSLLLADSLGHISLSAYEQERSLVHVCVHVLETGDPRPTETTYTLKVKLSATPSALIALVIRAKLASHSSHSSSSTSSTHISDDTAAEESEETQLIVSQYRDAYVLGVCGCDEVLYGGRHKLLAYKYVRQCVSTEQRPHFNLIALDKLRQRLPVRVQPLQAQLVDKYVNELERELKASQARQEEREAANGCAAAPSVVECLSWHASTPLAVYLDSVVYLPVLRDCSKLFVRLAVYHGQEMITRLVESDKHDVPEQRPGGVGADSSLRLAQLVDLGIEVRCLPRAAKLCVAIYCVSKKKRDFFPISCISLNLFEYDGRLASGKKKLYMWPATSSSFLNSSSMCMASDACGAQNPDKDFVRLTCVFNPSLADTCTNTLTRVLYPNAQQIAAFQTRTSEISQDDCFDVSYALENDNALLASILSKDTLAELSEQEKNVLWRRRDDCLNYAHSLPRLLHAVRWTNQTSDVLAVYTLLARWPPIKPAAAIELLSSMHPDVSVRAFAVRCLDEHMRDEEVQQYLLQLVQALKNEAYYECALARFLIARALRSQRIGFDLFWHLKSEMKSRRHRYRFGLMLEAYLRGISSVELDQLLKQVEVVERLTHLTHEIKSHADVVALTKSNYLRDTLERHDHQQNLSRLISPLNRSHILGLIDANASRILTSAKRPLFLTWSNESAYAEFYRAASFQLIFKHGDDLRQDMLTLQVIRLMDIIWASEGLDLKMLVYDCSATGYKTGFIQVIGDALTLFKIQMEGGIKGRYQIDSAQLYKWLAAHNNTPEKLDKAIELFTRSCAGFSVATFILGIGDRHPDNIMLTRSGQLFHIDFGHFLGNFKKKYGIKRERVPFVLTEDLVKVITRCAANPAETIEFQKFRLLCETAYMAIRSYAQLIVNLFTLMLASDMPELQSIEDIMFLRKTLAIDESDAAALEFFRAQFAEAYRLSYTTRFDWMCHALNKKNLV